jgi:hypothetical protein
LTKDEGKLADYSHIKSSTGIVIPEVKRVLLDRKRQEKERASHRTGIIYPSEMAKSNWCPRATYYRMSGLQPGASTASFTLENVFAEGNSIHSKWQRWLSETGLLWGDWRCSRCGEIVKNSIRPDDKVFGSCVGVGWVTFPNESFTGYTKPSEQVPFEGKYNGEFPHDWKYKEVTLHSTTHKVSGHADGALIKHDCLIEIKSLGVGSLRFEAPKLVEDHTHDLDGRKVMDIEGMWKNLHRPLLSHVKQGNIYLWMAKEMGMPFDTMVFLYEFKANQQVKEFSVKLSEDILNPMLDTAALIEVCLSKGTPPDCPHGGCAQCRDFEKGD